MNEKTDANVSSAVITTPVQQKEPSFSSAENFELSDLGAFLQTVIIFSWQSSKRLAIVFFASSIVEKGKKALKHPQNTTVWGI